jgi:hypothetical protein
MRRPMNPYAVFLDLLPKRPRLVGVVDVIDGDVATVVLEGGGGRIQAVGKAQAGDRVFVRDGLIEGEAPSLVYVEGEA